MRTLLFLCSLFLMAPLASAQKPVRWPGIEKVRSLSMGVFEARLAAQWKLLAAEKRSVAQYLEAQGSRLGLEPLRLDERVRIALDGSPFSSVRALPGSPLGCFHGQLVSEPNPLGEAQILRLSALPPEGLADDLGRLQRSGVVAVIAPSPSLVGKAFRFPKGPFPLPVLSCGLEDRERFASLDCLSLEVQRAGCGSEGPACVRIPGRGQGAPILLLSWLGPAEKGGVASSSAQARGRILLHQEVMRSLALAVGNGDIPRPPSDLIFGTSLGSVPPKATLCRRLLKSRDLQAILLLGAPTSPGAQRPRLSGRPTSALTAARAALGSLKAQKAFWPGVACVERPGDGAGLLELGNFAPSPGGGEEVAAPQLNALVVQARAAFAVVWSLIEPPSEQGKR